MDNFNDVELAQALTHYAEGQAQFSAADVKQCRENASLPKRKGKLRTLDVLCTERTGRNLNKPQFGRVLINLMFDHATKRKPQHRPTVRLLENVAPCQINAQRGAVGKSSYGWARKHATVRCAPGMLMSLPNAQGADQPYRWVHPEEER
jgi:hypothetical protein